MVTRAGLQPQPASAEQRLTDLGITLPAPPEPFSTYVEAVQTGHLLLLSGMLPLEGRAAKVVGRKSAELEPLSAVLREPRV
jgi:enamine deaminase RidA (YjgF/YER057c/UK114 family)